MREVELLDEKDVRRGVLRGDYARAGDLGPTPVRAHVVEELRRNLSRAQSRPNAGKK